MDIRLYIGLPDHPKILRLVRMCGEESFRCLIRLWLWARVNRPKGCLSGLEDGDIESVSGWKGIDGLFVAALRSKEVQLLDGEKIHDWEVYQGYSCGAENRSKKARKAAEQRWKTSNAKRNAPSMGQADAKRNAPSPSPSPIPLPSPIPIHLKECWEKWVTYRKEIKKKLTPSMITSQLNRLSKYPPEVQVECIEISISNGWTGLFPDKIKKAASTQSPPTGKTYSELFGGE